MRILKPFTANIDPDNPYTTFLHFEGGAVKSFYMRGAIAWPEGRNEGFALMAGYDLQERTVIIFEQFRYWTISHWLNDDGSIHEREPEDGGGYNLGLIQFLTDNFSKYRCCSYFRGGQHIDIWARYGREVYEHPQTPAGIELIEIPYVPEVGPNILLEQIKIHKFKGESGTFLSQSVAQYVGMQEAKTDYDNATLALMILLSGFEYLPWVELKVRLENVG